MHIQLSEHFTYSKLLRFAIPTIIMMVFTSIYSVVDGIFIAKYIGSRAFAATNFALPIIMLIGCIGFMFGTGGNALVAKLLGEKKKEKANQIFSMLIYVLLILGTLLTLVGIMLLAPISDFLGVTPELKSESLKYGYIVLLGTIPLILQFFFHPFMITAERPKLGLIITIIAGGMNVILDALFIIKFKWGILGAAIATNISELIGAGISLLFFCCPNKTKLHIGKPIWDFRALFKTIGNGMSEFVNHVSISCVSMLYIYQMLKYSGEKGVTAFGVIVSMSFLFISINVGYALGTGSVISYHYGAKNYTELKSLLRKNIRILFFTGIILTIFAEGLALPISSWFVSDKPELLDFVKNGFRVYAISYLLSGFTIYASGFFTVLNNGLISAIISLSRTFVFQSIAILVLPILFGVKGIFGAIIAAESLTFILSCFLIYKYRKKYHFL